MMRRVRRTLHVAPYMHPSAGGPPVAIDRWVGNADRYGWRGRVLTTPAMSQNGGSDVRASAEGRYEIFFVSSALAALDRTARDLIGDLVGDADIVHLHTMWSPLNALVAHACRIMQKPYVISPHGMLDPYSLAIKPLRKRFYLRSVERHVMRGAAGVLFTANEERDLAIAQVGHDANTFVVPLGADVPSVSRDVLASRFRAAHPEINDVKLVIFLGRLHPKKRPDAVIRAMPALREKEPQAAVLMVGSGEASYVNQLKRLATDLGQGERVHFLGHLADNEKWAALAASRVFVLPSQQENFAIAVAESLQIGTPVLITERVNIWREVVGSGAGLLLSEQHLVEDLAHHAAALFKDVTRCQDMGAKARAFASLAYTWDASTRNLCGVYDTLLATRSRPYAEAPR